MSNQAGWEWLDDQIEQEFSQLSDSEQSALMQPNEVKQDDGMSFDELIASMRHGEMKQQAIGVEL